MRLSAVSIEPSTVPSGGLEACCQFGPRHNLHESLIEEIAVLHFFLKTLL